MKPSCSGGQREAPNLAPALFRGPPASVPLLGKGKPFQALECDPIELGDVKLAFHEMLQGQPFGRAKLDV